MATTVAFEELIEVPMDLRSLADFRGWARSHDFPERGRIDYIAGRIEVDMSPEDIFTHGTLKTEIIRVLLDRVKRFQLGHLLSDRTRISSVEGDVSAEPDVVFISRDSLRSGRVRLVPKAGGEPGRYVEVEGAPDLIVEIVSDTSVVKDLRRLPPAYFRAGVGEFWLADARGEELLFQVHTPAETAFQPVDTDADGFQPSRVFGCAFRLDRERDEEDHWVYDLVLRETADA